MPRHCALSLVYSPVGLAMEFGSFLDIAVGVTRFSRGLGSHWPAAGLPTPKGLAPGDGLRKKSDKTCRIDLTSPASLPMPLVRLIVRKKWAVHNKQTLDK